MSAIIIDDWTHVQHTGNACHRHNLQQPYMGELQFTVEYIEGEYKPHFPVPAIRRQWWNGELHEPGCLYYSTNGLFEWLPN